MHEHDSKLKAERGKLHKQNNKITNQISNLMENENDNSEQLSALREIQKGIQDSIKSLSKKNNKIVWPASTRNGKKRTMESLLETISKLDNDEVLSLDEAKGVMGRSLFFDIPYFDVVQHMPPDYLHGVCLGVVKKVTELTFSVGENRKRNTTRKLSSPAQFNKEMAKIKSTREYSRRSRTLDFSVMKGQEFRNLIIMFFPIVINCIEEKAKERRLWLLLAYMIRVCIIPENEFSNSDEGIIEYCGVHFYKLYELLFNCRNCTYYTHVISCHLGEIRALGPLTETSAFGFESFYGELRNSFVPGTVSTLKQMLEKTLLKRSIAHHSCELPIYLSPKESSLESNCMIYTFVENEYKLYKIVSMEDDQLYCHEVGKYECSFPETPTLNWGKIGVFKAGGISEEIITLNRDDVAGKFLKVNDLFITCPNNVLREK